MRLPPHFIHFFVRFIRFGAPLGQAPSGALFFKFFCDFAAFSGFFACFKVVIHIVPLSLLYVLYVLARF